jgi:hypothetical protein
MKKKHFLAAIFLTGFCYSSAQTVKVPFDLDKWDTIGTVINRETFKGKESVLLKSGAIVTKNVDFKDGVIEVDMSFPQQRGFPGIGFRVQDINNFEHFYVRPHQSGNPDANQYTPNFNGLAGWQLYHGEGYTKAFTYKFNEWHHVKIDVHGLQAEIYIDDMQTPLIKVTELKREWKGGNITLVSGGLPIYFANLQYTPKQAAAPVRIPVPANGTDGMVTRWQVSNVVNRSLFEKKYQLTPEIKQKLTWTAQNSEPSGTINIAKFMQPTDTIRNMVVKINIESASEQVKTLSFGFSDYVTVFLNDKALYSGNDNFLSRDYRFLGTIGFFDKLFLPLKKGVNELWFVLSEDFGGWGVKAKFENMEGISLK